MGETMSRTRAAAGTAVYLAGLAVAAWGIERYPTTTLAGTLAATIYLRLRAADNPNSVKLDRDSE
jgi:hypothetical protein